MADTVTTTQGTETPAAQEPAAGSPGTETAFNIAEFMDTDSGDGEPSGEVVTPAPVPPTPAAQPPAATPPTTQTPPVTPTPVSAGQPVAASTQQTAQSTPAAPTAVPEPAAQQVTPSAPAQPDFETWQKEWPQKRQEAINNLANQMVLSEEDNQALLTDPGPVIKRLGAQIMVDAFSQAYMAVMGNLPAVFESYMQQKTINETAQRTFFERFPALNRPEFRQDIATAYRMYVQAKPNATLEEAMNAAGAHVHMLRGIPYQQPSAPAAVPTPRAVPPQAPAPAAPQQMRPFTPVGPGGSAPAPVNAGENFFTQLAQEFEREDF